MPRSLRSPLAPAASLAAVLALVFATGAASAWFVAETGVASFALPDRSATWPKSPAPSDAGDMGGMGMDDASTNLTTIPCPVANPPTAASQLVSVPATSIGNNSGFRPPAGVSGGSGTPSDPYRIVGIRTQALTLADTTANFVISGSDIAHLTLDWTGRGGLVCGNHIGDLRVNENVAHTGPHTAGVIQGNNLDTASQIRHYDGAFVANVVGNRLGDLDPSGLVLSEAVPGTQDVVLNIAGMNGADFSKNTIYGGVDMKLHGHHFNGTPGDWVNRHQAYVFRDNVIIDPDGFGLRYNDLNHAGDDRTATSDPEPELNLPHREFTTVLIENNTIEGAPIRIEVFNAPDPLILPGEHGFVTIRGNTIQDLPAGNGIILSAVRAGSIAITDNKIEHSSAAGSPLPTGTDAGVDLLQFANSTIRIDHNAIEGFTYGIEAHAFDRLTTWSLLANDIEGAQNPVWYDSSVANAPSNS